MLTRVSADHVYLAAADNGPGLIHQQVYSRALVGVLLDAAIAPIIDFLASSGVPTIYSCQGEPDASLDVQRRYMLLPTPLDLLQASKLLADLALSSGDIAQAARCLGRNLIESVRQPDIRNRLEVTELEPWRFSISRDPIGWDPDSDGFRAYAAINHEDIVVLGALLGYPALH